MGIIYSLFSDASGVNRIVGAINKSYLDRALKVYQSPNPPKPEVLQELIDDYVAANEEGNTSMASSFDKVKMMRGPDKRDNSLVLLAKIINDEKNKGHYDDIAKLLDVGEESFKGESGNAFWVYLFKKAALKYAGYFTATALNKITNEVTDADSDEQYIKQVAAVNAKLREDFFSDDAKLAEFKEGYVKYRDSKKFSGGKNMRGRRGTRNPRHNKRARKSIRK